MSRRYIFLDDSGDTGLRNSNTDQFIVAAVIVTDEEKKKLLTEAINLFRRRLGWVELHEFKFSKTEKVILVELIDFIKGFDFEAYVVVLDKKEVDVNIVPKEKISIYNHVLKELLLRVSRSNQVVTIDGKIGKKYDKQVQAYLRQNLRERGVRNTSIKFVDSRKEPLVQLADIIAGAVARSYKDKTDAGKYLKLLEDKIIKIDKIYFQA